MTSKGGESLPSALERVQVRLMPTFILFARGQSETCQLPAIKHSNNNNPKEMCAVKYVCENKQDMC